MMKLDLRRRVMVAAALAGCAVVLLVLDQPDGRSSDAQAFRVNLHSLDGVVDSLLLHYGIPKEKVKKWQVLTPDGKLIRTDRRVVVPASFVTTEFNRDLNRAVSPWNARVAATERTKESVVVLHIVRDGATVLTASLVQEEVKSR